MGMERWVQLELKKASTDREDAGLPMHERVSPFNELLIWTRA